MRVGRVAGGLLVFWSAEGRNDGVATAPKDGFLTERYVKRGIVLRVDCAEQAASNEAGRSNPSIAISELVKLKAF